MGLFFSNEYDELAIINSYSSEEIVKNLTLENVINFLESLGVEEIDRQEDYLVCPTICHNPMDEAESMKLYYYDKTKSEEELKEYLPTKSNSLELVR